MLNINGKEWHNVQASDIQDMLLEQDFEESFYFEFKDDMVSTKKLTEEVSAFANTFGGYILLGISDDKQIGGCTIWNEQKIHTTIHDSITPTPSFDVKRFTIGTSTIFVIKIDEGSEPPYITSGGKIYERLSSGSFVVKESSKLSQIYSKREQQLLKIEQKLSIPPICSSTNNIYGYIDIGFHLVTSDMQSTYEAFSKADLKSIASDCADLSSAYSLSRIGNSIFYTPGGLSVENGRLPAHTNNFLEIMADGSARMRILLLNNDQQTSSVNMHFPMLIQKQYQEIYTALMGALFPHKIAYAKKYESLVVRQQFQPVFLYDKAAIQINPDLQEENSKLLKTLRAYRKTLGITTIVTDDRIPKIGLYTLDKRQFELSNQEYTAESIINELFFSQFVAMAVLPSLDEES